VYAGPMFRLFSAILLLAASVAAQSPPAKPDAQKLAALFGSEFTADTQFPVLVADLDGDGAEDAVVVATAKNPLLDESQFQYKVVDPYHEYFGFGDPKVTAQFSAQEQHPRLLLVVHNWRAPRLKFVIINIGFEKLSLARALVKKKTLPAIRAEDIAGVKQNLYWDGKKWKWQEETIE
jgi:hypothetical protein